MRDDPDGSGPGRKRFWVVRSALCGVVFHVGLFLASVLQYGGAEYMGERNEEVEQRVLSMFGDTIAVTEATIFAVHAVLGLLLGAAAGGWLQLFTRPRSRLRFTGLVVLVLAVLHVEALWYGMTRYPQLFIDQFYNAGTLGHAFQWVGSELLPMWFHQIVASALLLSFPAAAILSLLRRASTPRLRSGQAIDPSTPLGAGHRPSALAVPSVCVLAVLALVPLFPLWGLVPDSLRFPIENPRSERPDVLLLAVDSLRPDYVERSNSAAYPRLASTAVVYDKAFTAMPRTFPAWVSMMTGQAPPEHGVRNMFPPPEVLARKYPTVATELRAKGWETAMFSDFAGDIFGRMDLGFSHVEVPEFSLRSNVRLGCWKMHVHLLPYLAAAGVLDNVDDFGASERYADPEILTDRFLGWLSNAQPDSPYFSVLFYSAAHSPYAAHYPYYRERGQADYCGPHRFCKVGQGGSRKTSPEDEEQVRQMYLASVDAVGDQVERILDALDASGRLDNTLVILTADHGENFWEHDRGNSHGDMLGGAESLQVPYMLKVPGRSTSLHVAGPVSHLTLAPTILGILGVPIPSWMHGENLAANPDFAPRSEAGIYSETGLFFVDPETDFLRDRSIRYSKMFDMFEFTPDSYILYLARKYEMDALVAKHRMLLRGSFKLIYVPTRQGAKFECYDVAADPEETKNVYSDGHAECFKLKEDLLRYMVDAGDGERVGDMVVPR